MTRHFSVSSESLGQAISQLRDSFLIQRTGDGDQYWSFKHPTISDAISTMLSETEGLTELYLRGTKPEVVLTEVVCSGASPICDATIVPQVLNDVLIEVLLRTPDEAGSNRSLFAFLQDRASDELFRKIITDHPLLLSRKTDTYRQLGHDARINVHARAFRLGIFPDELRWQTEIQLEDAILDLDTTFLEDDEILALIPPTRAIALMARLRSTIGEKVKDAVKAITDEIDYDVDAEEHFTELGSDVERIKGALFADPDHDSLAAELDEEIAGGIAEIEERQEEHKQERDSGGVDWTGYEPKRPTAVDFVARSVGAKGTRSIFSDVDE